ncbi:hypothetical protein FZW96_18290 [Bacillus sp. BGMRC 2118]|nr:hypothetical protein FZW96_18290 [Bacillus sp. BGMRC 2118]
MQSKTSWFNNQILLQGFRVAGWVGIVYTIALFFLLPLNLIMISTNENSHVYYAEVKSIFYFTSISGALTVVAPILVAIFILRYLQTKASSDLYHSLPIKRETLYKNFMTVGVLLVIIPVIMNGFILMILYPMLDLEIFFSFQSIFLWMGITLLINLFIFVSAVFVGMLTGNSMLQGVLSYIFLLFLIGVTVLVSQNLDQLLYGYKADYILSHQLERLSPLSRIFFLDGNPFTIVEMIVYIALTIILAIVSLFIYKARKLEVVTNPIAFHFLKPVFKYGVTFFSMLMGGFYFSVTTSSFGWSIFGYIIGALVGFIIAEMILQKTWRIIGSLKIKGLIGYAIVTSALLLFIEMDVIGFESRIPQKSDIERVYFSDTDQYYFSDDNGPTQYFTQEDNINNIVSLHEKLIQDKQPEYMNERSNRAFFAYELKNGRKVIREYTVPLNNEFETYLKPIYESVEYKNVYYQAMQLEADNIENITITARGPAGRGITINNEAEIKDLLTHLQDDIKNETYEEIKEGQGYVSEIMIKLKNKNTNARYDSHYEAYHSIRASYTSVLNWLKENGEYEDAVLTADEFEYILISKGDILKKDELYSLSPEEIDKKMMNDPSTVKITDPEKISMALQYSSDSREDEYLVSMKYKKENHSEHRGIKMKYYKLLTEN